MLQAPVVLFLVPLGILIIRRLLRKDKQKKKKRPSHKQNPIPSGPVTGNSDFYIRKLEKKIAHSGFVRKSHETYEQFLIGIKEKAFCRQDIPSLMTVIRIHKQLHFGPPAHFRQRVGAIKKPNRPADSKAVRSRHRCSRTIACKNTDIFKDN